MDLACSNIQQCHYLLAQGKVGEARERAVSAAREVAPLIDAEPRARVLAGFALSLVERIDQKKGAALSLSERVNWLTSSIHGVLWFPILTFGLSKTSAIKSTDFAPLAAKEPELRMPKLAPDFRVALQQVEPNSSLDGLADLYQDLLGNCSFVSSVLLVSAAGLGAQLRDLVFVYPGKPSVSTSDPQGQSEKLSTGMEHLITQMLNTSLNGEKKRLKDGIQMYHEHSQSDQMSPGNVVTEASATNQMSLHLLRSVNVPSQATQNLPPLSILPDATASRLKIRLYFNGCWREAALSPTLPFVSPPYADRSLIVRSSSNATLIWPALLEKAHVLVSGSHYDFTGSNMAHDTYILTRWWPEVFSAGDARKLRRLDRNPHIALGLGSGEMSPRLARELGVVPNHDYVVDSVGEMGVDLINPWQSSERTLHVPWAQLPHFPYVYANHRPQYSHSAAVSFVCPGTEWPDFYVERRPQYIVRTSAKTVHLVVEQFLGPQNVPFVLSVYRGTKGRVISTDQYECVAGGASTNARVMYYPLSLNPGVDYTIVVSTGSAKSAHTFSLEAFADAPVDLERARAPHKALPEIKGLWAMGFNGGHWALASYIDNPQYDIEIPTGTECLLLVLVATDHSALVNVHLFHREKADFQKKLRNFDKAKLLFSEDYTRQLHRSEVQNPEPGTYRLVVSCYDNSLTCDFSLVVAYSGGEAVSIVPVPQALGTFVHECLFEWRGANRHKLYLRTRHAQARVTFHVRAPARNLQEYIPAVRASVFDAETQEIVVVTSEWNNSIYGVFLECVLEHADRPYVLLVERFERGDGPCRITVGSSAKVIVEELK